MMWATIKVRADAARDLHRRQPGTTAARELSRVARELGIVLEPLHPGARDPLLVPYFTAQVPDGEAAGSVLDRLRCLAAIEAAYVKPTDELA